jgi:hypothetical protein
MSLIGDHDDECLARIKDAILRLRGDETELKRILLAQYESHSTVAESRNARLQREGRRRKKPRI